MVDTCASEMNRPLTVMSRTVTVSPSSTRLTGTSWPGAWLAPGLETETTICARAGLLRAVSMDMGPDYAKSTREHAPQAVICIESYPPCGSHVLANAMLRIGS